MNGSLLFWLSWLAIGAAILISRLLPSQDAMPVMLWLLGVALQAAVVAIDGIPMGPRDGERVEPYGS